MDTILDTVGRTPLVALPRLSPPGRLILAKLESRNPGGSVKDRIAWSMIRDAEEKGLLSPGRLIVEPTSGNTGIGLAVVAAARGYRLILTMPETANRERRELLRWLGAEVILTPKEKGMRGSIEKAEEIVREEGAFMPNQFENPANPRIHYQTTGPEILAQYPFPDPPRAFVAGVGTGGTITGAGRRLLEVWPDLRIVAVEPKGSPVLSGGQPGPAAIPGIGAGFIPPILDRSLLHQIITVSDEDAREWAYRLGREEGVLCGISSGAAFFAAREVAASLPEGAKVITVFPDSGERYLSSREGQEGL